MHTWNSLSKWIEVNGFEYPLLDWIYGTVSILRKELNWYFEYSFGKELIWNWLIKWANGMEFNNSDSSYIMKWAFGSIFEHWYNV